MDLLHSCYESNDEESNHDEVSSRDAADIGVSQKPEGSFSALKQDSPPDARPNQQDPPPASRKRPRIALIDNHSRATTIVTECCFVRSEPHVRGNWAGHVFVKVGGRAVFEHPATGSIEAFRQLLESRGAGFSGPIFRHESLHLSLSRPFYLQESSIDSFVTQLRERLQFQPWFSLSVRFRGHCLVNDDRTRSFWVWPVAATDDLTSAVSHIDGVLQRYNQPTYYRPPQFHVSVASVPGAVPDPEGLMEAKGHGAAVFPVTEIVCTFGTTKAFAISLH